MCSTRNGSDGGCRVSKMTWAPRRASCSAVAAPMPDVPPVIMTTRPCMLRSDGFVAPVQ